jgi:hypothetical protein
MKRLPACVLAAAVLATACGPPQPQPPVSQSNKLGAATGSISTACGEANQVTAFPGDHRRDLMTLEATAGSASRQLAGVYRQHPGWIFQGETVSQLVQDSLKLLGTCGLPQARAVLRAATR